MPFLLFKTTFYNKFKKNFISEDAQKQQFEYFCVENSKTYLADMRN